MQPNKFILQESYDSINWIDSKDWMTDTVIEYGTASAQQHIYKYRELGITYYFRVKGAFQNATPIYSNVITINSASYTRNREIQNTGLGYGVSYAGNYITIYKDKERHLKKQTVVNAYNFNVGSAKVGNKIYTVDNNTTNGVVYEYDIPTQNLSIGFNFGGGTTGVTTQFHRFLHYHQPTNSLYSTDARGKLMKRDLTTNTSSFVTDYLLPNNAYTHTTLVGDVLYIIPGRYNDVMRMYNIVTGVTTTKQIPNYDLVSNRNQYMCVAHNNKVYITPEFATAMHVYDIATDTLTTMATGLPKCWFGTISGDGTKFYSASSSIAGNMNQIFEIDLSTNATKTYPLNVPATCCIKMNLLENGKYVLPVAPGTTPAVFWSDGLPLTINPMDQIYNY
jgi:hypothetical protein